MYSKPSKIYSFYWCNYSLLFLCSVIVQFVSCKRILEDGVIWENENHSGRNISFHNVAEDYTPTTDFGPSTTIIPTPTTSPYKWTSLYDMSTGKIITLLLVSFSIPLTFMLLLFYRLQKEKKYLRSRAGALVYRETIIVPSYAITNASNDVDD